MPEAGGATPLPHEAPSPGAQHASQPLPFPGSLTRFYQWKSVSQRVWRQRRSRKSWREEEGTREKMVRFEVRVRERGRNGSQEHSPLSPDGPQPLGVPRRGVGGEVCYRGWGLGRSVQPHAQRRGQDTEEEIPGHEGRSGGRGSCLPELPLSSCWGKSGVAQGWERTGHVPLSYSQEPGQNPCRKRP